MDIQAWTNNDSLLKADDTIVTRHIRDLRRLADDSMTLLDEKKEPSARRNYTLLRDIIMHESQQFKDTPSEQAENLTFNYITTIHNLSDTLPETPKTSELYDVLSRAYKKLHQLIN
ncbi:hypothetical protein HYQ40_10990 [Aerococcaceae bacterium DSM 111021]|nr:hypothetical protein [Aerococcaceae bacterium DSM 111021]